MKQFHNKMPLMFVGTLASSFTRIATLLFVVIPLLSVRSYAAGTSALAGGGNSVATICAPATDMVIYSFSTTIGSTAQPFTAFTFSTTGTAVSGTDITNFTLWRNNSNTIVGATSVGSITTGLGAGSHTLSASLNQAKNNTFYYFITATIPSTATNGRTIAVSAITHAAGAPFTYSNGPTYSGTSTAGGTQTISVVSSISGLSSLCGTSSTTTQLSDATGGGVWASSNTSVATISGTGLLTGVSSGLTTISYTVGSCYSTLPFSYTSSAPVAISGAGTICPPSAVTLLSESFEYGVPPSGWGYQGTTSIWYQTDAYSTWSPYIGAAQDGTYVAEADFYDYSGNSLMWSSPFSMVNVVNGMISFWVFRDGSGWYPYSCGYSTEGFVIAINTTNALAGATNLGFVPRAADGPITGSLSGPSIPYYSGWYQYTVPIPASYTGSTNYLLIRAQSQYGNSAYIDNIQITGTQLQSATVSDATPGGTWSSSNTSIVKIDASGNMLGASIGSATVTYTNSCGYVTKNINVLNNVTVTGPTAICPSTTTSLSDATVGGNWTSSSTSIATVSGSGVVTGVSSGSAVITYSFDAGCYLKTPVTVNPLPANISGNANLCLGANVVYSDATSGGIWSTASTSVATADGVGNIMGVTLGTTTVSYTLPTGCYATKTATVNPVPVPITVPSSGLCVTDAYNPTVTLVDGTTVPPGTWTSSNPSVATIVSFSGQLTGVSAGTTAITYTLPTGCMTSTNIVIDPVPAAIVGTKVLCANASSYLSDALAGGLWSSSNTSLATIESGTGIVTGISGLSNPLITYTSLPGCKAVTTLTVNAAPGTIIGSRDVCMNSTTSLTVGGGGTWSSANPGIASVPVGPSGTGVVSGIVNGNVNITYTLPVTGCYAVVPVTVNPVPAPITGSSAICFGDMTTLNDATPGGAWISNNTSVANVSGTGDITSASPGSVNIDYILPTGCKATIPFTVNTLPIPYTISNVGAPNYCASGTGVDMQLNLTTIGINYQLYNSGTPVGGPVAGTGSPYIFSGMTTAGTYTVIATDPSTKCSNTMAGSALVIVDPLPVKYALNYSGASGNYCDAPGAPGIQMCIAGSQSGFGYFLYDALGNNVDIAIGTGSGLCFAYQTNPGAYTVIASDPVSSCTANMLNSLSITRNPLPIAHNVTVSNGGNYCAGGTGVHVGLDYANTGINYELWFNGITKLTTMAGGNSSLDFGVYTNVGSYNVVAVNPLTNCTANMLNTITVNTQPLPAAHTLKVLGSSSYCTGSTGVHLQLDGTDVLVNYQLQNAGSPIGGVISGTGSPIDYYNVTALGSYTVLAVDAVTGCSDYMTGSPSVASTLPPSAFTLTTPNGGNYCAGGAGLMPHLSGSQTGVRYDLYNSTGLVDSKNGTGTAINFTSQFAAGAYNVIATDMTTSCTSAMTGNPSITINALPTAYTVTATNSGAYCAGDPGVNIGLSFSEVGVSYQLWKGSAMIGTAKPGSGSSIDFGVISSVGTYSVVATNTATTCASNMTGSANVIVNPTPVAYTVTGGGSYCYGTTVGVPVGLSSSEAGIEYQLWNGTIQMGSPVTGTGTSISFGNQLTAGKYTITANNNTTGCTKNMTGSVVITVDPLPTAYNVTGGGRYCAGSTGLNVGLSNSMTGVNYQLLNNGTPVATLPGVSGSPLNFGLQTAPGTYTVIANTIVSGCTTNMNGNARIVVDAKPAPYVIKGGGNYCPGTAGSDIYLSGSQPGISYQLINSGSPVGGPVVGGSGGILDLGLQTVTGSYTAIGTDLATGCTENMTGSVTVNANTAPLIYTVTGGGIMCAGLSGFHIIQTGSEVGISYQLLNSGSPVATIAGTGMALDFGAQTLGGTYTVVATNTTTGCTSNMMGSGLITVNPSPIVYSVSGGGHFCIGTGGVPVNVTGSETGINYQLYVSGSKTGTPVGGTGMPLTFGPQTKPGIYTAIATNTGTGCSSTMSDVAVVTEDPVVIPSVTIAGTDGTSCIGDVVHYKSIPVNGGSAPTYVWKVRGVTVSTTDALDYIPVMGDVISVWMTSNEHCALTTPVSNSITANTLPYIMPAASTIADPGNYVCQGSPVTYSAAVSGDGSAPGYDWMKNGAFVGSGTTYTYVPADKDIIVFMLRSNYRCRIADTVFSDPIVMNVDNTATPVIDSVVSHLGPIIGVGQVDTFVAYVKNNTANFSYQWYIKNAPIPGATTTMYVDHNVFNNDEITFEARKTGACGETFASKHNIVNLLNLGTKQVAAASSDVSVLPNPSNGEFIIKGSLGTTNDAEASIEITNMLGQTVYSNYVKVRGGNINERITLGNTLANGMYILNLRSDITNNIFHIIVER